MPEGNTPSTSGSRKMWYIIGGIVVLLLLGWLVTRGISGAMMAASGAIANPGSNGSMTYTDAQGNSATVGGTSMPDNWPSDAPANFAGATIVYSGSSNPQTGQAGSAVSYTVHASAQAIVDYYKQQLTSAGWTVAGTANAAGAMVVSATKDTRTFGAYIADTGDGTVTVTAGIGM